MKTEARTFSLWNYIPFACGSLSLVWQVLFLYVPLGCVLVMALSGETWYEGFVQFISYPYVAIVARSLTMALLTATVCLLIGYPFAYFLVFRAGNFQTMLLFLVMLPFWTNFLLHICAWYFVLDQQGVFSTFLQYIGIISQPLHILNSMSAIALMMIYFYIPFMILPLYAALDRFDKRLLEASLDLGATWWQTVRRILLPMTMSGVRVGFLLVCIPAFGEFIIPELMGGDRIMFVGSVIQHFILKTESEVAGAAFTFLAALVLVVILGILYRGLGFFVPAYEHAEDAS